MARTSPASPGWARSARGTGLGLTPRLEQFVVAACGLQTSDDEALAKPLAEARRTAGPDWMEQEVDRRPPRRGRELLHARDERRDADPRTDPVLAKQPVAEAETAVRALGGGSYADLRLLPQSRRVVTDRPGDEGGAAVPHAPRRTPARPARCKQFAAAADRSQITDIHAVDAALRRPAVFGLPLAPSSAGRLAHPTPESRHDDSTLPAGLGACAVAGRRSQRRRWRSAWTIVVPSRRRPRAGHHRARAGRRHAHTPGQLAIIHNKSGAGGIVAVMAAMNAASPNTLPQAQAAVVTVTPLTWRAAKRPACRR